MTLWIICGACSGVGKTFVAKRLCAILPKSVYAKLGHGPHRRAKSKNYFTQESELKLFVEKNRAKCQHIVIESNRYQPDSRDVIRIFLESGNSGRDIRPDAAQLKQSANLCVSAEVTSSRWMPVLKAALDDDLVKAVYGILAEQQRLLENKTLAVRSKIWMINRSGKHVFGCGLASLLEEVEHLGSLSAAAESADMSYRHAWGAIRDAEKHLGFKLLVRSSGGIGGGGSQLTQDAKRLLAVFRRLNESAARIADREFAKFYMGKWSRKETAG